MKTSQQNGEFEVTQVSNSPLPDHPEGRFSRQKLFDLTFSSKYPDAVNQAFKLFDSRRSGDLLISADPGYDLRMRHEHPEHRGSHGALHHEHMSVPIGISVPLNGELKRTSDVPPTLLRLTGNEVPATMSGTAVAFDGSNGELKSPVGPDHPDSEQAALEVSEASPGSQYISIATTVGIIVFGLVLTLLYQEELFLY